MQTNPAAAPAIGTLCRWNAAGLPDDLRLVEAVRGGIVMVSRPDSIDRDGLIPLCDLEDWAASVASGELEVVS